MIRLLAAAAVCAAACQTTTAAPAAGARVSPPAGAHERPPAAAPVPLPDAGPPPDPARTLLEAARASRLRIAKVMGQAAPDADAKAIGEDAEACAADAHRSWAAQFPEAAAAAHPAQRIGPLGAEALYLEAVCGGVAARMQGFTPLIEKRAWLSEALLRVAELAPDLDGAGAERELGSLYAALPAHAGGDLDEARRRLLAALERAPRDARNHLALAGTVAVKAQDRALFHEHAEIAARSGDALVAPQAEALLRREDELFGPAEAAQPIPGGPPH